MRIYTGGSFDNFHRGHRNFLRQCAELGKVIVSLNTDDFITSYKKQPPTDTFEERKEVLLKCTYVDEVVANLGGANSKIIIEWVNPDAIAIGSDWARKDYYKQMGFTQDWLDERGISLIYIPYTHGISSTQLKEKNVHSHKTS